MPTMTASSLSKFIMTFADSVSELRPLCQQQQHQQLKKKAHPRRRRRRLNLMLVLLTVSPCILRQFVIGPKRSFRRPVCIMCSQSRENFTNLRAAWTRCLWLGLTFLLVQSRLNTCGGVKITEDFSLVP